MPPSDGRINKPVRVIRVVGPTIAYRRWSERPAGQRVAWGKLWTFLLTPNPTSARAPSLPEHHEVAIREQGAA